MLKRFYRSNGDSQPELCFYIDATRGMSAEDVGKLAWLASAPENPVQDNSRFSNFDVIEIGPKISYATPFSDDAVSICKAIELPVKRLEHSIRYPLATFPRSTILSKHLDRMTQTVYEHPLETFYLPFVPAPIQHVSVLEKGIEALRYFNAMHKLGIDEQYMQYYYQLILRMKRNFTDAELFQLANANSDHSRHLFWRAILIIDGVEMPRSLMEVVQRPWRTNPGRSLVAFADNAGAIAGHRTLDFAPMFPGTPSAYHLVEILLHIIVTAETHNYPTLVAAFQGAATGPGGRIRDNRAFGRSSHFHAGTAGYFTGNLFIPGYAIPGEVIGDEVNPRFMSPLEIMVQGSNGVSHYANLYGEPNVGGFRRTFGQMLGDTRYEARKPTLFTGGIGRVDARHLKKHDAEIGMLIIRLGGLAYPIGFGGGAASSGTENTAQGDQNAVQRAGPKTENGVNRVLQACVWLGDDNPIESIHDQGAGGPSNVLTELVEKIGGRIDIRKIRRGDETMSPVQVWLCEFQESYGLLIKPEKLEIMQMLCRREGVNCEVLGEATGTGRIEVYDSDTTKMVDLNLKEVLTDLPRQRHDLTRVHRDLPPLQLPVDLTVERALDMILPLPSVGSKGDLAYQIDRSVGGKVVRQPCCGSVQIPVADVGVTADSFFGLTGAAIATGEQPIVGLIDAGAGVRTAIAESLTNILPGAISRLEDVTFQANWMWAVKVPGEGARLWDATNAMADFMEAFGVRSIGGKDSSSMNTQVGQARAVTPGQFVATAFAPVPDIRKVLTPDFKGAGNCIGYLDMGCGRARMGGSALAQAHNQLGNECPDIEASSLKEAFLAIGKLIDEGMLISYHDVSDGGLVTTLVEMCLSGNRGARIRVPCDNSIRFLFNQELGFVFEYRHENAGAVEQAMKIFKPHFHVLGATGSKQRPVRFRTLDITTQSGVLLHASLPTLRQKWEGTSLQLQQIDTNLEQVEEERKSHAFDCELPYHLTFTCMPSPAVNRGRYKVAVVRDEGTNGDLEMAGAWQHAGCTPVDINMQDIIDGSVTSLDEFRGMALCGGFSRADVFGSARGWAAIVLFNSHANEIFSRFHERDDTFTLGVCNGCQLMTQLGWIPTLPGQKAPYLTHNRSGRFEHRVVGVEIRKSPSIFFDGMEGSAFPIVSAHGEGLWVFSDSDVLEYVESENLAPVRFVTPDRKATERYPFNPNGSPHGIAALCSLDGRRLAMMPHPERSFLPWQWQYSPPELRNLEVSPLLKMFQNAHVWCRQN